MRRRCIKCNREFNNAKGLSNHNRTIHKNMCVKDKVGYAGIHHWVRRRLVKLNYCYLCKKVDGFMDLANKSNKYKRDLNDWHYICRSCHMSSDNRVKNFHDRKPYTKTRFWRYKENSSNWKGGITFDRKKYLHEWYLRRKEIGIYV